MDRVAAHQGEAIKRGSVVVLNLWLDICNAVLAVLHSSYHMIENELVRTVMTCPSLQVPDLQVLESTINYFLMSSLVQEFN